MRSWRGALRRQRREQIDDPMRILFLSHYYPPEVNAPASRTSEHCRAWIADGHETTVVTCAPNHPVGEIYPGYSNRLFQRETINGVDVVRVWTFLAANEGFARRIANYLSYMVSASVAAPFLRRPDVVISTSPQFFCGLAGFVASRLRRVPWVLEIRDLWPESIVTVGAMRRGLVIRILEAIERFAYRKADRIVSVTDSFVPHIAERCGDPTKIHVIKNGVDLDLFDRDLNRDVAKRALDLEGKIVAAYVGTHGMAHGLDALVDAAVLTRDDPNLVWLLVGDGAERTRLVERAQSLGLTNIRILGQRPKSDMPTVWAATDVSLIVLKKDELFKKVLPSKMFEAMGMARPIVLGVEGEAAALLAASGGGIAVEPGDVKAIAKVTRAIANNPAEAERMGRAGHAFVTRDFDRARLARRFLEVLAQVVTRRTEPATEGGGSA
jgi:glycosyltransferase involved in cell wall biosynthesis